MTNMNIADNATVMLVFVDEEFNSLIAIVMEMITVMVMEMVMTSKPV